jgi:hypothetical protein
MHGRQILQGHFGKHYKLHFIKNGPVPRSLTPLRFVDSHSARRFLAQLHTPQSYWQWLTRDYHDVANFSGHQRDYLQVVSNWVLQGRLRIYEVELPDSHALSRSVASLQDRQGYQFQFAPMKQALASLAQPQRFNSIQQVYQTLYDLAPNLEQLQSVVADLQLIPAPEQQTYSQLMDALAEGLTEERVALYINAPFKRPEPAGAAAETAANMPGNRKVELAPAVARQADEGTNKNTSENKNFSISAAAQSPRIKDYEVNPNGLVRSRDEAIALARSHGIEIPDDINIQFVGNWKRKDTDAEYFDVGARYKPDDWIEWDDFMAHRGEYSGTVPVRINQDILNSDEALLANIAHEMHELNSLKKMFDERGALQAKEIARLVNTRDRGGMAGNLHEQAWDISDALILKLRGRN